MKRLIEKANKQIAEHLDGQGIKHNDDFCSISTDIDWKDVPDDLNLSGHEIQVMNIIYPDCHLHIVYDKERLNRICIRLPEWMNAALFAARMQGQDCSIDILSKMKRENEMIHKGLEIPYINTVG